MAMCHLLGGPMFELSERHRNSAWRLPRSRIVAQCAVLHPNDLGEVHGAYFVPEFLVHVKRMFVERPDVEPNFVAVILLDPPLRKAHQLWPDALAAQCCRDRDGSDAAELQWLRKAVLLGCHVHRDESNNMAAFFGDECLRTFRVHE
jgi:hypothetical protein